MLFLLVIAFVVQAIARLGRVSAQDVESFSRDGKTSISTRSRPSTTAATRLSSRDQTLSGISRDDVIGDILNRGHECGTLDPTPAELNETATLIRNAKFRRSPKGRVFTSGGQNGIFRADIKIKFTVFYDSNNNGMSSACLIVKCIFPCVFVYDMMLRRPLTTYFSFFSCRSCISCSACRTVQCDPRTIFSS